MFFTTGMVTFLLITSFLQPVTNDYYYAGGVLLPELFARIGYLERALYIAPRLAFGAAILAQGSAVIGSRVFRDYVEWRKHNPLPSTYAAGWTSSGWQPPSSGWGGWGESAPPRVHDWYERASQRGTVRGHRTLDFLTFTLGKSRLRARARLQGTLQLLQDYFAIRASDVDYARLRGGDGWGAPAVVVKGAPVVKEVLVAEPAPVIAYDHGPPVVAYDHGPPPPLVKHAAYIPASYGAGVSYTSGYGGHGGEYYSSPVAAGHSSYGGGGYGSYGSYSSRQPVTTSSRGSGYANAKPRSSSSSKPKRAPQYWQPEQQDALSRDEFRSLMAWAEGQPLDYSPAAAPSGPRTVRIKRQHGQAQSQPQTKTKTKTTATDSSASSGFLPNLVDDVGRFFTVVEFLDENKCLQKFVCNVHSRARSFLPEPMVRGTVSGKGSQDMSPFESSIVAAFKILDTFMPKDDESYKGYREAALIGAGANNATICTSQYSSCTYSANDIMDMNSEIEAQAKKEDSSTPKPEVKKRNKNGKKKVTSTTSTAAPLPAAAAA